MRSFAFYLVFFLIVLAQADGWAQIGISGTPHPSAVLDLKSSNNDKAFYPPRLTSAQRLAILNPQAGAMVYDTDKGTIYLHDGRSWLSLTFADSSLPVDPNLPASLSITASDGAGGDYFGYSVAIEGDYALVGATYKRIGSNSNQGAVYVFVRSGNGWIQQQRLTASDGEAFDFFGNSVALLGNYALVGAPRKTIGSNQYQGVVYVFMRSGNNWIQQQRFTASDGTANDSFGISVALSGEYALVGATYKNIGSNKNQGAAYVFVRSDNGWIEQQRLTASDGAASEYFGYSVALSGEYALVGADSKTLGSNGAQGAAYVFVRSGSSWSQQQQIIANDGETNDHFGHSVALWGEYALVGAYGKSIGNNGAQGAAYVFMRSGSSWSQQQRLTANDGAAGDVFGISVALSNNYAIVGAYGKTVGSNSNQGAAYLFMRSGTTWSQRQQFTDNTATRTGFAVGLSGRAYIVGAPIYQNYLGKVTIGTVN